MNTFAVRPRQCALAGYTAWMALLVALYYLVPGVRFASWGLLGLSGSGAIVAGAVVNRPARKLPWLLLAAANLSFISGQVSFLVAARFGFGLSLPSFADGLYLAEYPLCAAAIVIFIRYRSPERDCRSLIDALILTVGLALLSWIYLVLPYARNPDLTWLAKSTAIAYPLGDVLVLAMIARLLAPGTARSRTASLLTLGAVGQLAADVSYGLIALHGGFRNGTVVDLGWAVLYTAWGAAALHPTMAQLTQPAASQRSEAAPARLIVLVFAALIGPTLLFIGSLRGDYSDSSIVAVFSALLYLLVLWRLWDVARSHRRTLGRERALRQSGLSLAAAGTIEQAALAAGQAALALLQPDARGAALLGVQSGERLTAGGAGLEPGGYQEAAASWLPLVTGTRQMITPSSQLGPDAPALPPGCDSALLWPLLQRGHPSGEPLTGLLAVFGQLATLTGRAEALEILAGQAALTAERIMLSQEVARQRGEAHFRTLVQDTSDAILILAGDGTVRYATPSAAGIFGNVEIAGTRLADLAAPDSQPDVAQALARLLGRPGQQQSDETWELRRRDGRSVLVEARFSDLREDPTVSGLVLTLRDVTERRQLEARLTHQAYHDALTGLPNRLLFQERAARAMARARQDGTVASVLFVDLDDFKLVNDTMGLVAGDELLAAAARRLASVVGGSDTAARLGGDEFALLVEQAEDLAATEALAGQVVEAFREPFSVAGQTAAATVTVGIASTADSADVDELLRHADLALYAAKAAGKRTWRAYQRALSVDLLRRREVQVALEAALRTSAFTLAYQPIVDLATGDVAGFEALVRWPHPQWGMMQPGQFIALAEETGHIVPLGTWILRQATADMARWRRGDPDEPGPYVSVNVSARQFRTPGFTGAVARALADSGLNPSALTLELTESALLSPDAQMNADLVELDLMGVRLAIDDFGTGYSSLSYLRDLPVRVLKIDKSFVDGITVSRQQLALVDGIIKIAGNLELQVIAEGIETAVQRNLLASMGCRYGQGYLLAMPGSAEQAEALIKGRQRLISDLPG